MVIFKHYFSREHMSFSLKKLCEHKIQKTNWLRAPYMIQNEWFLSAISSEKLIALNTLYEGVPTESSTSNQKPIS